MSQNYTPEFKKKIVRLHEEEGRTYKSITAEYGVSKASISKVVILPKGEEANSTKNAKPKPKPIQMPQMKWNL